MDRKIKQRKRKTYQVNRPHVRHHGEAVDLLGLEIAQDGRPNSRGDLVVRRRLVGHPASLEITKREARAHFVHSQWPRHQREHPSVMHGGKDECSGQAFPAKFLQDVEDRAEPQLEGLDDAVVLVFRALRDQAPGVVGEEVAVVPQVEPLGVPPSLVRRQPHRDVLSGLLFLASLEN